MVILTIIVVVYVSAHKQELIGKVKKEVSEKLNGNVQIGNIDLSFFQNFPSVSILFENVSITDTMFAVHHQPFFKAEKVYGILGIGNAMMQNNPLSGLRIDNGEIHVFTDTAGYTNAYLFSPKKKIDTAVKTSTAKTEIESIRLRNVRIVLDDKKKHKLYDFAVAKLNCKMKNSDNAIELKNSADILIHSLAFNTDIGSYVKEAAFNGDFALSVDKIKKQLSFDDIKITLNKQPFRLAGHFDFPDTPTFAIRVASKNIDYTFAKKLLTNKIATALSLVQLGQPVSDVVADISGPLSGGEPLVNIKWTLSETDVQSQFVNLAKCSMRGSFTNEMVPGVDRYDPNSRLHFQHVSGVFEGLPITSENVFIDNLYTPMLRCDVKANFDLAKLNDLLGSNAVTLQQGKGDIDITYDGPLENNSNRNTLINGKLSFSDGSLIYLPRKIEIKNVSGNILFKNTDVLVTDFKGTVKGNKILMDGSGKNLLALIKTNPGRIFIDWNIYSPAINLNSFTTLLQRRVAATNAAVRKSKLGSTARQIDEIVDNANFRLKVKADELLYRKFRGTNVKAILSLANEDWALEKINLEHAGGQMRVTGLLSQKTDDLYQADVKMNMEKVDVNKVMYAFDNFGQHGIESDNLKGKLDMNAAVKLYINRNTEQPSDINGYVDFSIKNGALLHYEPLKKVQNIIFKKRNFDEIYFAELKDRISIQNQNITISRMEIQSTALTLFVEGLYSLHGNTDLSIQVPISNLKKRSEDYVPENNGADSKGGASIYIRGQTGEDGTVAFKLDVFRKLRKKK